MITIYDANETDFTHNGLGVLSPSLCDITEAINGMYELELEHPRTGKCESLVNDNVIKADGQLFRIYRRIADFAYIKVNARHIFYDLLDNFLEDVRPTGLNGFAAIDWMFSRTQYPHRFIVGSNIANESSATYIRKNPVHALLSDDENSFVNRWGGEIKRDNFNIEMFAELGMDRGVVIKYKKNLQGFEDDSDYSNIVTRLMPLGKEGLVLPEKYIDSPYINSYPHPKISVVEFPDAATVEELRNAANMFMFSSKVDMPRPNYKVNFIYLAQTQEYKNFAVLETVYIGDTVSVKYEEFGYNLKAKVIKYVKDVLQNRYKSIELGTIKSNFTSSINKSLNILAESITATADQSKALIDEVTNQITSALGGHVLKRNGELLIMDTEDIYTATKVWRWNVNGLAFSKTGYNGPYETAITSNGVIVADFIASGTLNASLVKAGILKGGKIQFNLDAGTFLIGTSEEDYNLKFDGSKLEIRLSSGETIEEKLEDVENNVTYKVDIISTQGSIFKNGIISTTLIARVYKGIEDVTDQIDANRFRWKRQSMDSAGDVAWNASHFGGVKQISITKEDVQQKATFSCEILDETLI